MEHRANVTTERRLTAGPVAIAAGRAGERVNPTSPAYAGFFDLLRAEGRRTQSLDGRLTDDALREFDALLIGVPKKQHHPDEVAAVHAWVARGGSLLLLASLGGQDMPDGDRHGSSNLSQFAPGVTLRGDCLGVAEGRGHDGEFPTWIFQRHVSIPVDSLVGDRVTLGYLSGCTFAVDVASVRRAPAVSIRTGWDFAVAPVEVIRTLAVPSGLVRAADTVEEDALYAFGEPDDLLRPADGYVFAQLRYGEGTVTVFGGARSLTREGLARDDTLAFALWMLSVWLPAHTRDEVARRKARPQRHRLLHGYPMAPLMPPLDAPARDALDAAEAAPPREGVGLIVGVLPHTFCNPAVRGCGFCTFPHEVFSQSAASEVAAQVVREITTYGERVPAHRGRAVRAVYLGGGTANLTPLTELRALGDALTRTFSLDDAEVTFEGVPVYFTARRGAVLDAFVEAFAARHRRVSMGVQTFDAAQLARMGRTAFGDRAVVEGVVRAAHARAMTASCDLLFNLPGQDLAAMRADVDAAVGIGFDHVCLYHLVMFEGLGTEWSHDRSLLAALPDNRAACDRWNDLRERLLAAGFVQTSLTNFERADVHASDRAFRYEPCAYTPEENDLAGFGPGAISLRFGADAAWKSLNADSARDYVAAMAASSPRARAFTYDPRDRRVLYLTRKVVTLRVDRGAYRAFFGTDPVDDFPQEFEALRVDRLVTVTPEAIALTPKGMFYADTVAGLLAWRRVHARQCREALRLQRIPRPPPTALYDANNSNYDPMG